MAPASTNELRAEYERLTAEVAKLRDEREHYHALYLEMLEKLRKLELGLLGQKAERLPNTCAVALPGLRAETALIAFDLDGVAVSSGAACSSGKVRRSAVLDAMGISGELAEGAIRISLGWNTTEDHIEACLAAFARRIPAARANSTERAA